MIQLGSRISNRKPNFLEIQSSKIRRRTWRNFDQKVRKKLVSAHPRAEASSMMGLSAAITKLRYKLSGAYGLSGPLPGLISKIPVECAFFILT